MRKLILVNNFRKGLAADVARGVRIVDVASATVMNERLAAMLIRRWNRQASAAERVRQSRVPA